MCGSQGGGRIGAAWSWCGHGGRDPRRGAGCCWRLGFIGDGVAASTLLPLHRPRRRRIPPRLIFVFAPERVRPGLFSRRFLKQGGA